MSYLWPKMEKLRLTTNMRALSNTIFSDFLLHVRNGDELITNEDMIEIPNELIKHGDDENPKNVWLTMSFIHLKIIHT